MNAQGVNLGPGLKIHCARQAEELRPKCGAPGALEAVPSVTMGSTLPPGPGRLRPSHVRRAKVAML